MAELAIHAMNGDTNPKLRLRLSEYDEAFSDEELAQWLVDHHVSFFAGMETDYQHWLEIIVRTEIGVPMFAAALPTGAAADPQHLP